MGADALEAGLVYTSGAHGIRKTRTRRKIPYRGAHKDGGERGRMVWLPNVSQIAPR
jgi:hypothetical protein